MTIISKKARRFITFGVNLIPDLDTRAAWLGWVESHPVRAGASPDEHDDLPSSAMHAALLGLDMIVNDLRARRSDAPEDQAYQFDNDLSYAMAISRGLRERTKVHA